MTGKLELTLLGQAEVHLAGEPVTGFYSAKAQALLFYLAVTGQPHPRPALAGLLWADMPEADALMNLRQVLTNLRKLIGPYLTITRQTVAFNRTSDYWLDVAVFQAGVEAGQRPSPQRPSLQPSPAGRGSQASPPLGGIEGGPAVDQLRHAVDLYRGDFLAGFYVRDAPVFEEWLLVQQARLRELALDTLHKLAMQFARQGDYGNGIAYSRRLLALEPWHEETHRQLMRLLARSGQRSAALAQYQTCRQVLAEELGLEPSLETIALVERIQAAETAPRPNLPLQPTSFIGRQTEVAEIQHLLLDEPGCWLLTLVGPGGIGKTRLALAAATQTFETFPQEIYFASLASVGEVGDIVPTIAEALRFTFYGSADPKDQLLDYLSQKTLLLVVDNFEHLLEGAGLLSEILSHAPDVTLLATSRERLNLQEEWVYEVQGLPFPAVGNQTSKVLETFEVLDTYSAVELFLQRARQAEAGFGPAPEEMADIGRICQLVKGMPLGLELAAPWIKVLNCQEIAAEIERSLDFLTTSLQNVPKRHRSLRVVFEQTWGRLSPTEQAVLSRLSVFRGGCTREAAEHVTGATLPVLASLVDKALLRRTNIGRYELHALLHQFAHEKLSATPDDHERTLHQYCRYYAALLQAYELEHKRNLASPADYLSNILSDWQNIQTAWHYALARSLIPEIGQFVQILSQFYEFRGLLHEGEKTFDRALAQLRTQANLVDSIVLVRVLTHYGWFCMSLSKLEQAGQLLEEALALSLTLNDEVHAIDIGLLLHFLVWLARLEGQPAKARDFQRQNVKIWQKADYQMGICIVTLMWGDLEYEAGNYDTACQYYEQALTLAKDTQLILVIIYALVLLGNAYIALGNYAEAIDYLQQGLILSRDFLLTSPLFTGLLGISSLFRQQGCYGLALELIVIVLNHPQCDIVAQHHAKLMISKLRSHISDDEIKMVMDKAKRGQLSNPYIDPNFRVDAEFIDQLLALLNRASGTK